MFVLNQSLSMPVIAAIVYVAMDILKEAFGKDERLKRFIPIITGGLGAICGLLTYLFVPDFCEISNAVAALVFGAASGLSATGTNQIVKQLTKKKSTIEE